MTKNGEAKQAYLCSENIALFTKESYARGERYYYEGKVNLTYCDENKEEYHANVMGNILYAVRIDCHNHLIKKAICNCPYHGEGKCKHIAATLLSIANQQSGDKDSIYQRIKEYAIEGMNHRSLTETLNRSFADVEDSLKKKELSLEELPQVILNIYRLAHSYFFIGDKAFGVDAVKRIEMLELPGTAALAIYLRLFSVLFDEAKRSFFIASLKSDFFQKSALKGVIQAMENRDYYEYRALLSKEETNRLALASFSEGDLAHVLSLPYSYLFTPVSLLNEIKRRKAYRLLTLFVENQNETYEASFLREVGSLLENIDKEASKKTYRKMLVSRGLTLSDFLFFYRSLTEEEKKENLSDMKRIAFFKGYDKAFAYLLNRDQTLLRNFSLMEWDALAPEIRESDVTSYTSILSRALENALNRKKMDRLLLEQILSVLDAYPDEFLKKYRDDPRLLSFLSESSFSAYFALLYRHSCLEESGYHKWEE